MAGYSYDDSRWPLLVHRLNGHFTDGELEEMLQASVEFVDRGVPYVMMVVIPGTGQHLTAAQRKQVADFERTLNTERKVQVQGLALVTESRLVRGIFTAIQWVNPRRGHPEKSFASEDEAEDWLRTILDFPAARAASNT
jgi:hypothetical protein